MKMNEERQNALSDTEPIEPIELEITADDEEVLAISKRLISENQTAYEELAE